MIRLNAKARIAFGQVGLLLSVLFSASFLGIIPDKNAAIMEGRAVLAEALAINSSALVTQNHLQRLKWDLELVVDRNPDLLSAGLRTKDRRLILEVGPHQDLWVLADNVRSTGGQVQVPIWAGNSPWGVVELRFKPLHGAGWSGWLYDPFIQLLAFVALFSFIVFYFYLGKMLKHLDPSNAIPGRVRSALDTMAEGLVVLDKKERIMLSNYAFNKLLNKKLEELLGSPIGTLNWSYCDNNEYITEEFPWSRALDSGQPAMSQRIRLNLPDQPHRTFMTNCSPVQDARGGIAGVLISFDDITVLEEQEIELLESKERAEAANSAKSDFLAHMSHEIRTPMNAILGFTELMLRGLTRSEEESKQHLQTVYSSGNHLLNLINDILDLSKVESGSFELDLIRFNPYKVIQEIVKVLDVKAREKGIQIDLCAVGEAPEYIISDPGRIRQIITNLLGNAIKFTDQGSVSVVTNVKRISDSLLMEIQIIDSGVGMSEGALQKIFEPFVQADSSVTRQFGGTGLGLAISRKFAQALGGDITVKSALGKGSAFTVSLKVEEVSDAKWLPGEQILQQLVSDIEPATMDWSFAPAAVLIVDDVRENRELARLVMEKYGLSVEEAENGQQALECTSSQQFDLILMDIQMPVMDGFTAVGKMREQGLEIPVVALTANAMKGAAEACLAGGFSDYYSKPIKIESFVAKLASLLNADQVEATPVEASTVARSGEAQAPQAAESPQMSASFSSQAASSMIRSNLPANDQALMALANSFAGTLGEKLLDMHTTWQAEDFGELARQAHWLRGAAGTVGFDVFTTPSQNLETAIAENQTEQIRRLWSQIVGLAARIEGIAMPKPLQEFYAAESSRADSQQPGNIKKCAPPLVSSIAGIPNMMPLITEFIERLHQEEQRMQAAWLEENLESLAESARWLKGSGGMLGFESFTEPASELEQCALTNNRAAIPALLQAIKDLTGRVQLSNTLADTK